ncbi:hypothetical protein B0T24DRAFT_296242 [Lasiosphaeria ovina]|uniref:Uncharacterized protein n=1 Tax=Lasiosphaeria ovina TaxID=92902 RepID=A0AAE0KE08_9PEZI|nr:hypothetical protein B0T24DRAFT_296242 [Lasiosphaeria ovina]
MCAEETRDIFFASLYFPFYNWGFIWPLILFWAFSFPCHGQSFYHYWTLSHLSILIPHFCSWFPLFGFSRRTCLSAAAASWMLLTATGCDLSFYPFLMAGVSGQWDRGVCRRVGWSMGHLPACDPRCPQT